MSLLIVGDPEDLTSAYVAFLAKKRGMQVHVLDECGFGNTWWMDFSEHDSSGQSKALNVISFASGLTLRLSDVSGAYVRFTPTPAVPPCLQEEPPLAETFARERRAAVHELLNQLAVPVANPPGRGQANGSKPLQMAQLVRAGFAVPEWIVSNQPEAVQAFSADYPCGVVVKSCSGVRSEVRACSDETITRLAQGSTPVIAQARIEGFDVRVHTVGHQVFATAIEAGPGTDYRFDKTPRSYHAHIIPTELAERCTRFAAQQGLLLAGFDFRIDPEERWWCLECNPAPTFLPYEMSTGQPIAQRLLDLLKAG